MTELLQGLWIGSELSLMEQLSIKSFLTHGHPFHLYVYEKVKNVPDGTTVFNANDILPKEEIFQLNHGYYHGSLTAFSNLFRFKLLLEKGGWWCDLDIVCLKPFDFIDQFVITSEHDSPETAAPSSAVLKVPKGDPFVQACFNKTRLLCVNPATLDFGDTGYKLVREMVEKFDLQSFVKPPATFAPFSWWDQKAFTEPQDMFRDLSDSYAIHLYNEMWRLEGMNKNEMYSEKSLYGSLLRRYL